jgi:uncharacterized coiled-coil protein SlyX
MLEQRATKLEEDMGRINAVLERLEPKINEILLTGAKQADLHRTQVDVAELKGRLVATEEKLTGRMTALEDKLTGRMTALEEKLASKITVVEEKPVGRISGVEGRMSGLESRVAALPSAYLQLGLIFTTWGIGSGIVFSIAKFAR